MQGEVLGSTACVSSSEAGQPLTLPHTQVKFEQVVDVNSALCYQGGKHSHLLEKYYERICMTSRKRHSFVFLFFKKDMRKH
jgi:hypothetical protein